MENLGPFAGWIEWVGQYDTQLGLSVVLLLIYAALDRIGANRIESGADQSRLKASLPEGARRALRIVAGLVLFAGLIVVWGIDVGALLVLSTTIITLTGVALFASWSLLSNVTAYFVILFNPAFRRGTFLRVIDLDNYIEGYIADVSLFHTRLITENRETIVYPNNLLLMKPCLINPRNRLNVVGKTFNEYKAPDAQPGPRTDTQVDESHEEG